MKAFGFELPTNADGRPLTQEQFYRSLREAALLSGNLAAMDEIDALWDEWNKSEQAKVIPAKSGG